MEVREDIDGYTLTQHNAVLDSSNSFILGFHVTSRRLCWCTEKKRKKVFWEFDSIIMQNLSDILPLFCTTTWPSHHVSENQEFVRHTDKEFVITCFYSTSCQSAPRSM